MENETDKYWKNCVGCIYFYDYIHSCNYIFVTGHPRGCIGGDHCKKKTTGKRKPGIKAWRVACKKFDSKPRREPSQRDKERKRRLALWKQGMNDTEIAEACGVSVAAIHQFRRFNNLPPNADNNGNRIVHDWDKYKV